MAADGAQQMPAALCSDLSVFYPYADIDSLEEPPAGQLTSIRNLAGANLGRVDLFRRQQEGGETVITQPLLEMDQAIAAAQMAIHTGDAAGLTEFVQELTEGGGLLRTTLAAHGWDRGTRAFGHPPDLSALQGGLLEARMELVEQLQDVLVVGKVMPRSAMKRNECKQTNEAIAYMKPMGPPRAPDTEDAWTEIGVLSYLRRQADLPAYLLRLLGISMFGDDDSDSVLMVTEFADGGELLLHVMHGTMVFTEERVMRYAWQLLQATCYLHGHCIGHRDISLENIVVTFGADVDGQIRLMDFGQAVRTHSLDGQEVLRFFRLCGKNCYRAPECYLPPPRERVVALPPRSLAPREVAMVPLQDPAGHVCEVRLPRGYAPGEPCEATVWGYAATPVDVFSCGVAVFILAFWAQPWHMARLTDPHFKLITSSMRRSPGALERLVSSWPGRRPLSGSAMELLESMLRMDPADRPPVEECLRSEWFAPMDGTPVPRHQARDPVAEEVVAEGARGGAAGSGSTDSGGITSGSPCGADRRSRREKRRSRRQVI